MFSAVLGLALAFLIGSGCRLLNLPLPAPPQLSGALLVLTMTLGFVIGGNLLG